MPSPTITQLGASTVTRKWLYEVNAGSVGVPSWLPISGITTQKLSVDTANWVNDTENASQGFSSQTKTGATWGATLTVKRAVVPGTVTYDPGQEFLRAAAIGKFGPANTVQIRAYEYDPNDPNGTSTPRVEAYLGFAGVEYDPQGGDPMAIDTVNLTLNGQGKLNTITHPYPAVAVVPTVSSVTPSAVSTAGGQQVVILGTGFTGTVPTTGVKFGGTNATSWVVVSDTEIVALTPAHSAGTAQVVVTNAAGASTSSVNATYS